ncbi:MAG TPA: hypothetical protein VGC95_04560 [Chitinophagaceae bacterium]
MRLFALYPFMVCAWCCAGCRETAPPTVVVTGLKIYNAFDSSRRFDTTGNDPSRLYRPVRIDLFYPSGDTSSKETLTFGDLLDMYERRMDYNVGSDSAHNTAVELARSIADYLKIESPAKLLAVPTGIEKDPHTPTKRLPLIVYAASMNGSSWENFGIFDSLAHHGYVIASISSVGKFPGFMSDAVDMNEQVYDILFAIRQLKSKTFIDSTMIGCLSWSLGGTAIVKAAMLEPRIRCLLSYDGTEIHYYGFDTAWDTEYRKIMRIAPFEPDLVKVPYMYLSSEHPTDADSIYLFPNHTSSPKKYFLKFKGAIHENFSALPAVATATARALDTIDGGRSRIIAGLTITFFDEFLKNEGSGQTVQMINALLHDTRPAVTDSLPLPGRQTHLRLQ